MFPAKRQSDLSVQPLGDELVVIDLERRDVFRLNPAAAWLWERCDGHTSVHDLAAALPAELLPDADEDTVWASLRELSDSGLLEAPLPAETGGISRRKLLATVALIGGAGVIAPLARGAVPAAAAPVTAPERASKDKWKMSTVFLTFAQPGTPVLKWGFSHLEGLGAVTDVTQLDPGNGGNVRQIPDKSKWTPIVLKRGITSDMSLWKWQDQITGGDKSGIKSAKLTVVDPSGNEQLGWNLTNAWPDNLTILPADTGDVVYEQVEIVLDSSDRYK